MPLRAAIYFCCCWTFTQKFGPRDQFALDLARKSGTPVFLLLNKIDLVARKDKLLPIIDEYRRLFDFKQIVPLSARKKIGLDVPLDHVVTALPKGPPHFPEDQITDQPLRFMAAELIREQVLARHQRGSTTATTVMVEQFEEGTKLTRIAATIYCERDGQKRILVGRQGQMLKTIGTAALCRSKK